MAVKYRKISPRIWNDAKVRELTDKGKLALLFMLPHPYMTPLGAIRANAPGLACELGWSSIAFRKALGEIIDRGIARADEKATLIWFPNFLKHNLPESPNVVRSWPAWVEDLPESFLKEALLQAAYTLVGNMGEGFRDAFAEAFPKGSPKPSPKTSSNLRSQSIDLKAKENTASVPASPSLDAEHSFVLPPSGNGEGEKAEPTASPASKRRNGKNTTQPDESHYQAKSHRYLTGKRLESFNRFFAAFGFAKGKAEAADAWLDIPQLTDELVNRICHAARLKAAQRDEDMAKGKSPKWAQGWLNSRRWEDYDPPASSTQKSSPVAPPEPIYCVPTPEEVEENRQRARELANRMRSMPAVPERGNFSAIAANIAKAEANRSPA